LSPVSILDFGGGYMLLLRQRQTDAEETHCQLSIVARVDIG